ncbi:heavy metal translocating P-type ATPase [Vineibacter terrae]|nr:heavy metal translocating P-type ATPase [Vineibacter terrae]
MSRPAPQPLALAPCSCSAPTRKHNHDHDHDHDDDHAAHDSHDHGIDGAWWQSEQFRFVLATVIGLAIAYGIGLARPAWSPWLFGVSALVGAWPVGRRAAAAMGRGKLFTIESLMVVAVAGALVIGEAEEAAVVVILFLVGEMLESISAARARAGIRALADLMPRTAARERGDGTEDVPIAALRVGDILRVRPGDRIPADGVIVSGQSTLDESPVTGESIPVFRAEGTSVLAGTVNLTATLRLRVEKDAEDNTIARIIKRVEEAQESKAPTARFIDRFSRWYTPAAMLAAAITILLPPLVFGGDWHVWAYRGLSLLLIACPCALVLSTPAAIASGLAAGARRGLLMKGGAALEAMGTVRGIAFDKTGTLTAGRPKVTDLLALDGSEDAALRLAAAVEQGSTHPIAHAIIEEARQRDLAYPTADDVTAIAGKAVHGRVDGRRICVASPRYAASEATAMPAAARDAIQRWEGGGKTAVVVLSDRDVVAVIAVRDEPREDARQGLAELRALGVATVLLSGDNRRTAGTIGQSLGIDVKAELLPDEKLGEIATLKSAGPVAMVGDGINDAPALAAATVGIAMGGGTQVALETADAALLRDRVRGVAELVRLSRTTLANIHQNIAISLGLKAVFLATTLMGTTTMWMAILADTGATVIVTLNALRLLRFGLRSDA